MEKRGFRWHEFWYAFPVFHSLSWETHNELGLFKCTRETDFHDIEIVDEELFACVLATARLLAEYR